MLSVGTRFAGEKIPTKRLGETTMARHWPGLGDRRGRMKKRRLQEQDDVEESLRLVKGTVIGALPAC